MKSIILTLLLLFASATSWAKVSDDDLAGIWLISGFAGIGMLDIANQFEDRSRSGDGSIIYSKQVTKCRRARIAGIMTLMLCAATTQSGIKFILWGRPKAVQVAMVKQF